MLSEIIKGTIDLIYPWHCVICSRSIQNANNLSGLCAACYHSIRINKPPFCPKCSRHLGKRPTHRLCNVCQKQPAHYDFAWAACVYEEPLKTLLHHFKYHRKKHLQHVFQECIVGFIHAFSLDISQFDLMIPVPLHPTKLRERGFNQSEILAKSLLSQAQCPLQKNIIARRRSTPSQTLLSQKERWTNMQGAFTIKTPQAVKNKSVLIIDDLLTTGATVSEVARELKRSGSGLVGVLTLAIKC